MTEGAVVRPKELNDTITEDVYIEPSVWKLYRDTEAYTLSIGTKLLLSMAD
jgi:hypothetical protein